METYQTINTTYRNILREEEVKLKKVQQRIFRIGTLKLFVFTAGVAVSIYCWSPDWQQTLILLLPFLLLFLYLIKIHNRLFHEKEYLEKKIEVNQQELDAMDYNIASLDGGEEFIDPSHLYSYDLDLFGEHSMFQYINRTATEPGKKRLADWFNTHLKSKHEIEKRQEAVKELAQELEMRQHFRISGLLYKGQVADEDEINAWAESPSFYRNRKEFRILPYLVLTINAVFILLAIIGELPASTAGTIFVVFVTASLRFSRSITRMQSMYGKKLQILGTYARLIRIIEEKEVKSSALKEIQQLVGGKQKTASKAVQNLTSLMNALDQRNNILVATILNGLFFWELRQFMKIEFWKEEHAAELPLWLKAIGEMDAFCSLSTFAYNHPDYAYPEIANKPFQMQGNALGHPLMFRNQCVCNGINVPKQPFFVIITGANMAGKSTYLRTIGVNYLLACIGAPVWAEELKLYPAQLITSLRTSDSLTENESYFFAELKRLKLIIDKLNTGEKLFIILDEILKGTNSMDKQKGSLALIKQFMALDATGIIATHDLLLGTLSQSFPDDIHNYCFEADIADNELRFSYQMKEGIAQNMNACFLMKKMGIAVIDE